VRARTGAPGHLLSDATVGLLELNTRCRVRRCVFGVARSDIEVVFERKNVNEQLRIKAPNIMPAGID